MRISAELLERAEQRVNPNLERELVIRGLGIPSIENMAAARDDFDAWDLSNNRIMRLENLPRVKRLKSLYCAGNIIESIDARNLSENASNITSLSLSHNNISSLLEMVSLGKACPKLEFLSLDGNPVTSK
jgi:U2 small nuclear ribonucleoprotein A'